MLYNLRSDIIYYKSGSDFELEFNLCGCCRMRLLTDKPSNKKAFVHSLARAVSRSRVILIAGPLFGQDNTIETVAQALGTTTEVVNNNAYNISSEDEISIIKGSLPLVSGDGSFGGCIIESGPQTMVLLTDNKTLRKNIMTNLIHPYISELYSAELKANSSVATPNTDTKADDTLESNTEVVAAPIEAVEELTTEAPVIEEAEIVEAEELVEEATEEVVEEDINYEEEEIQQQEDALIFEDLYTEDETETDDKVLPHDIEEPAIILEADEETEEPETDIYSKAFNNLYLEIEQEETDVSKTIPQQPSGYQVLYDDGEVMESDYNFSETRNSRLNLATIIVTVILLLSIIAICYCIFSASSSEGMAPAEYIRSVWQTVFG